MQGIRIDATLEDGYELSTYPFPKLPAGGYGKDNRGVWRCRAPIESEDFDDILIGNLGNHQVEEHEDKTISVQPSILITGWKTSWHGYLERGVWRTC